MNRAGDDNARPIVPTEVFRLAVTTTTAVTLKPEFPDSNSTPTT